MIYLISIDGIEFVKIGYTKDDQSMKVRLMSLQIEDDNGNDFSINLWNSGRYEPSDRELDGKCTIHEWRENNELLPICDNHFESIETHEMALTIVALINREAAKANAQIGQEDAQNGNVEVKE
jgi:hypothetical protein